MDYTNYKTVNATTTKYDEGLRSYMLSIYNYMALALALTGTIAFFAANSPAIMQIVTSPMGWIIMLAPIGIAFAFGAKIGTMSVQTAQILYWVYAGLLGLSLAPIFIIYTGESIARVFFITASLFGAMSLYGYTTKRDLSGFGHFLMMGMFGLIIASLVNIFLKSSGMQFAISVVGVLIFTGLTAYDTQNLKRMYYQLANGDQAMAVKLSILGALKLYMDFLNLFLFLLRFMGDRRN